MIIVEVALPLPIRKYFKYLIPDFMSPVIGGRIIVPLKNKYIVGIIVAFYKEVKKNKLNFKYVDSLLDTKSIYHSSVFYILIWINKNYHCTCQDVFFSILPKKLCNVYIIKSRSNYFWNITKIGKKIDLAYFQRKKRQLYALLVLRKNKILCTELKKYNVSKIILKKLEFQKLCKVEFDSKKFFKDIVFIKKKIFLDKKILFCIRKILAKKNHSSWLLTRFSLYNKVKFYLGLIKSILYKNMQVLIMIPYIKYMNMIITFLKNYFNVIIDKIHSQLTNTEYFKIWIRTQEGYNTIIIGTKKSIFLPFQRLGIIIFLEEHSLNYKNINECKYNIRDIAILRAYKENIPIILDSDTPSSRTLHNIAIKKYFYIKLNQQNYVTRPTFQIVDLKKDKIRFSLSLTLINEIYKNFKNKQTLLIFNRFNLFFFILKCNFCNFIFKCSSCFNYFEINQYHREILFCRFCLMKIKKPNFCHECGSLSLTILNISIEKIKHKIQSIFPKIPLFFLLNKNDFNKDILNKQTCEFSILTPCIIITKEAIIENYYFPHVSLISLISIDNYFVSLYFSNMEYLAQFYTNLRKLTKSKKQPLKILIQTSRANDSKLKDLCENGYFAFVKKELEIRKKFSLPPYSFQVIVYSQGIYEEDNIIFLNLLSKILKEKSKKHNFDLWLIGPDPCFLLKSKKKYLHQLRIQSSSRVVLSNLLNKSIDVICVFSIVKRVKWFIHIDPN